MGRKRLIDKEAEEGSALKVETDPLTTTMPYSVHDNSDSSPQTDARTSHRLAIKKEAKGSQETGGATCTRCVTSPVGGGATAPAVGRRGRGRPRKHPVSTVCTPAASREKTCQGQNVENEDVEVFCEVLARVSEALLTYIPGGVSSVIQRVSAECRVCWQKSTDDDFLIQGDWTNVVEARSFLQKLLASADEAHRRTSAAKIEDTKVDIRPLTSHDDMSVTSTGDAVTVENPGDTGFEVSLEPPMDDSPEVKVKVIEDTNLINGGADPAGASCGADDVAAASGGADDLAVRTRRGQHRRTATRHPERASHECGACGYRSTAEGVKKHAARRHAAHAFRCDVCDAGFGIRYDMRRHRVVHFDARGALTPAAAALLAWRRPGVAPMTLAELEAGFRPEREEAEEGEEGEGRTGEEEEEDVKPPPDIRQLFSEVDRVELQIVAAVAAWSYRCERCDARCDSHAALVEHHDTAHAAHGTDGQKHDGDVAITVSTDVAIGNVVVADGDVTAVALTDPPPPGDAAVVIVGDLPAACDVCDARGPASDIVRHMATHHADAGSYCRLCRVTLPAGDDATYRHVQRHFAASTAATVRKRTAKTKKGRLPRERTELTCKVCERKFIGQSSLSVHMRCHRVKPVLQCDECDFTTCQRSLFNQHWRRKHGATPAVCAVCGAVFSSAPNLQFHMRSVHATAPACTCAQCGRAFSTQRFLRVHEKRVHRAEKRYFCGVCGKGFFEKVRMNEHEHIHGEYEEREANKKFTCSYCGKRFLRRSQMQQHENIHTGNKPYKCLTCGKAFCYTAELRKHMAVHSTARPHRCTLCGKGFKFRYKLTEHTTTHTKVSRHRCADCHKCFTAFSTLRRHRCRYGGGAAASVSLPAEVMSGDPVVYMCGVCSELFSDQDAVNAHVMLHDAVSLPVEMAVVALKQGPA